MKNNKIRLMAYMAIYAALYVALKYFGEFIPFLKMPQGGSIEIELAVVFIASFHLGAGYGILTSLLCLAIQSIFFPPYYLNFPQFCLDYVIPLVSIGAAGLVGRKGTVRQNISIFLAIAMKYLSQVLSGVYYWAEGMAAGSKAAWMYSLGYNIWYNLATCVVCMILVPFLLNRLQKANVLKKI